jgi:hypothetical protein
MTEKPNLKEAIERRDIYLEAERTILKHGKSFSVGGQTLTRADLPDIQRILNQCDSIINGGVKRTIKRVKVVDD